MNKKLFLFGIITSFLAVCIVPELVFARVSDKEVGNCSLVSDPKYVAPKGDGYYSDEDMKVAYRNLHAFCCTKGILGKTSCEEPGKNNKPIKIQFKEPFPDSPYLYDHLVDIAFRKLDGDQEQLYPGLEVDKQGGEWRTFMNQVAESDRGANPLLFYEKFNEYRSISGTMSREFGTVSNFLNVNGGNRKNGKYEMGTETENDDFGMQSQLGSSDELDPLDELAAQKVKEQQEAMDNTLQQEYKDKIKEQDDLIAKNKILVEDIQALGPLVERLNLSGGDLFQKSEDMKDFYKKSILFLYRFNKGDVTKLTIIRDYLFNERILSLDAKEDFQIKKAKLDPSSSTYTADVQKLELQRPPLFSGKPFGIGITYGKILLNLETGHNLASINNVSSYFQAGQPLYAGLTAETIGKLDSMKLDDAIAFVEKELQSVGSNPQENVLEELQRQIQEKKQSQDGILKEIVDLLEQYSKKHTLSSGSKIPTIFEPIKSWKLAGKPNKVNEKDMQERYGKNTVKILETHEQNIDVFDQTNLDIKDLSRRLSELYTNMQNLQRATRESIDQLESELTAFEGDQSVNGIKTSYTATPIDVWFPYLFGGGARCSQPIGDITKLSFKYYSACMKAACAATQKGILTNKDIEEKDGRACMQAAMVRINDEAAYVYNTMLLKTTQFVKDFMYTYLGEYFTMNRILELSDKFTEFQSCIASLAQKIPEGTRNCTQ